jgi:predicted permease
MTVSLPKARYATDPRVDAFYRSLLDRVRRLPGVRAAGAVQALPLTSNTSVRPYQIDGGPAGLARPTAHYRIVTPGYLEAMQIPLHAGRTFTDRDTGDRPLVVIVNETLRRQAWGDRNPIGQRITFGGSETQWAEVVGLVGDVHHFGPAIPAPAEMYWPSEQIDPVPGETLRRLRRGLTLVIRADDGDPLQLVPAVRQAVRAIDPDQPIASIHTMAFLVGQSLYLSRAAAWLVSVFGAAALVFALLGIFGAASFAVVQRRRELAVRMALGAGPDTVARLVLASTLRGALAGVLAGVLLALALGSTVRALLVGVEPGDPMTLAAVSLTLIAAAAAACWVPARRAARIDPMQALRLD